MRGRRPKPSRIKALTGNPGKRPINVHEPRPVPALPDCPPELSPAGRQEWARLSAELSKLNLITHLDRGALATYCAAYGFWTEALEQIQKYGAGRVDDTHRIRVRLYTREPQPNFDTAAGSIAPARSDDG
jgi:P27 family predicted phage terminase small subunit